MTTSEFTIYLSAALRAVQLTHPLYDIMSAVAALEAKNGFATIPQIHLKLSCTYNNCVLHLLRNPELFTELPHHRPRRIQLSPAGVDLMARVKLAVDRRAATSKARDASAAT